MLCLIMYVGSYGHIYKRGVKSSTVKLRSSPTAKGLFLDYLRGHKFATDVQRKAAEHVSEYGLGASHAHHVFAKVGDHRHAERNLLGVKIVNEETCNLPSPYYFDLVVKDKSNLGYVS